MAQIQHECVTCGRTRNEKHMIHHSCFHGGWWSCTAVKSCRHYVHSMKQKASRDD